ncbi:MAG TPA: hypothetical protein VFT62_09280 [Mycobacteriales bacterium]|nr:hypothetical protein [Mycobacteriales bacterium]
MQRPSLRGLSGHFVARRPHELGGLLVLTAGLMMAGAFGMSYVAGFGAVHAVVGSVRWHWLVAALAAMVASFLGLAFAYRGVFRAGGGRLLTPRQMWSVVLAGFAGFLSHGGGGLESDALRAAGAAERDVAIRVSALAGLEQAVLAIGGCGASIAVLLLGLSKPTPDFTLPWAIIPLPAFLLAFWVGGRYAPRLRHRRGWRGHVGVFLDVICLVRGLFERPVTRDPAVLGMGLFWAAETFAMWASLAAFGFHMSVPALIVGYATGLLVTRRTAPLGGAGLLMVVLPVTIWYSGAPFATAVVGVFAYRVITLWVPMPLTLATIPALRQIAVTPQRRPAARSASGAAAGAATQTVRARS